MDVFKDNVFGEGAAERRTTRRFHIEQQVNYKLLCENRTVETGRGATVNMSSGGLWLATDHPLSTGVAAELAMDWPVLLNGSCPMKLMIFGHVLRSNDHGVAIVIERYEFRTRSPRALCDALYPKGG